MRGPDVIVIGAGQAGLSTSYCLSDRGIDHAVLEKGVPGDSWAKRRWDSFTLVTPNWTVRLPGAEYRGPDPDGFMGRDDFVAYLSEWAGRFGCPIRTGIAATGLGQGGNGRLRLDTTDGPLEAAAIVVATGTMQTPRRPALAASVSSRIRQLDAETYRNPGDLAPGAVLVVGSGQTGGQIADDLRLSGRRVLLSVGGAGRVPRRYRGRDSVAWLAELGFFDRTPDMLESPAKRFGAEVQLSGARGGRTIGLHLLRRDGVEPLGRLTAADGEKMRFADDLRANIENADGFSRTFRENVDAFVARNGIDAPLPTADELDGEPPEDGWSVPHRPSIDLLDENVTAIVWATGFSYDFSWIDFSVCDGMGYPVTDRGATSVPGLYFMGLNWMASRKSGLLYGVGDDARHVAGHIAEYLAARR
ncbi:MAG: NAD(P)-binding domain-containing protein [Defluviicoccus sp.]|nr:NAD(P)-binding domain-containing protein [Defluviicoccus sp.]MDE0278078.1 NAD(P)-binding domain-containing protein [Defluviicoccus sp.]